jgi:hypothetical protein
MIENLIARVFYTRNLAHWTHWRIKSYAQHVALGSFYDGIIDALDKLVEARQGSDGIVGAIPPAPASSGDILEHLETESAWIADNRDEIANGVTALENLVDELSGVYLSAIYMLKNFK